MSDLLKSIAGTADGVFAVDSESKIILWNHSAEEMLGFTPREVLGKFCYEVLPGTDLSCNLFCFKGCSVMTMTKKGQLVQNYDIQVLTKNLRKIWLNVSILLVPNPDRRNQLIVHLFRPFSSQEHIRMVEQMATTLLTGLNKDDPGCRMGRSSPGLNGSHLSRRETEVLYLMAQCVGTKEIADRLCISYTTVRTHIKHILEKLHAHNKLEAVTLAFQKGLLK